MHSLTCTITLVLCLLALAATQSVAVLRQDIGIRDPFIYCDPATNRCYMYGTTGTCDGKRGFDVRETSDPTLQTWSEPKPAFRSPEGFWGVWAYWAPEVHEYKGKYYLFATFEGPGRARAVQILSADSPRGPFKVHSPEPINGPEYFSLDGGLYVDKKGDPWMVYSREHISINNGEMRAVRLKPDLTAPIDGTDILLFKASSAEYAAHWNNNKGETCYLTDGPQMLRLSDGSLVMAWSTNNYLPKPIFWGYTVSIARSTSGDVQGPWVQEGILYNGYAGHGQIFRHPTLGLILSVHQPNNGGRPYPLFLHVYENKGKLTMAEPTPSYVQAYWRFEDCTPGHTVLPSIDILDSSGKDNHLRGDDFGSVGTASSDVPAGRMPAARPLHVYSEAPTGPIPAITRLNLFCYDNTEAPKDGAAARYLTTVDKPINKLSLTSWTVEACIRPSELGKRQIFLSHDPDFSLGLTPQGDLEMRYKGQEMTTAGGMPLDAGKWYSIAVVCDGKRLDLSLDSKDRSMGQRWTLTAKETAMSKGQWTVGCEMRNGKPTDQFRGLIDEVRICNKALAPGKWLFPQEEYPDVP